jgi:membrane protease YdiL (CAAX protease family)
MNLLKGAFKNLKTVPQLLILVSLSCLLFYVGLGIWMILTHGNTSDIHSIRLLQLIQSVAIFLIPPFLFGYLCSDRKPTEYLALHQKPDSLSVRYVILIMLIAIPLINLLSYLNQQLVLPQALAPLEEWMKQSEEEAATLTQQLLETNSIGGLFFNLLLIALIPALGEELFFRGALQNILSRWKGIHAAIWITGFLFSAFHLQFYGFFPRWLLGVFFGYTLIWSGSLWLPVIAHFTNNAVAVIFYYFSKPTAEEMSIDNIGASSTWWLGIISAVLTIYLIFKLKSNTSKRVP